MQSNKSDKGAICSLKAMKNTSFDLMLLQDVDTILLAQRIRFFFVITMATTQRLVVNMELGLVGIFNLE